jgi:hypothetical protein
MSITRASRHRIKKLGNEWNFDGPQKRKILATS